MRRRRRILIFFAALLAAGGLLVVTLPWWLGVALRAAPDKWGVRFARYERIGYGRFALHDVEYRGGSVRVTATRIESDSPVVWLTHRWSGRPREVVVEKWAVIVEPQPTAAAPATPVTKTTAPTTTVPVTPAPVATASVTPAGPTTPASHTRMNGWMPLRALLLRIAEELDRWLPRAKVGEGRVVWPGGGLTLASAAWEKRTLDAKAVALGVLHADVTVEFPAGVDALRVKAKTTDGAGTAAIENRGDGAQGEITWWEQRATLNGKFGASGWLPAQAIAEAEAWSVAGAKLKLGSAYAKVRGRARVDWSEEHFRADVALNGEPIADKKEVPPLEVRFRGYGDLKAFSVETLHATLPGIVADLDAPVMVDREGRFAPSAAKFSVKADLAKQPWFEAKGMIEGEARWVAGVTQKPVVEFRLQAHDVAAATFAVTSVEASGGFAWPEITFAKASIVGTAGERLEAHGGWDFRAQELLAVAVEGEIRRATLARWLPAQLQFDAVAIKGQANGPLANAEHSGEMRAGGVVFGSVKPLALAAAWSGRGEKVEKLEVAATAGETRLTLAGAMDREGVRLGEAELTQKNESRLRLTQPAVIRWSPGLRIEGLRLVGAQSAINADLAWGETGSVSLAVHNIPSAWLSDLVVLPGPGGEISSIAITGAWDRGPMTFSAVLGAAFELGEGRRAVVNLSGRGDKDGVRLEALRAAEGAASIVNASGFIPVTFAPGQQKPMRIDERAELLIDADTAPNAAFWTELAGITGLELQEPHAAVHLKGTWQRPEGSVQLKVARIAADAKRFKRPLPTIEGLDVAVVGDPAGLRLDTLAFRVEGQEVKASGRVPIPEAEWGRVWKEPLAYVQRGADVRFEIPDADLAVFTRFLPTYLAPKGRLHLDLNYKAGAFDGNLRLNGAATRPLGPLGVLQEVEADVRLAGRTLEIRSVTAKSGGEDVKLTGKLELPELKKGEPMPIPKFDVALQGTNLPFVRSSGLLMRGDLDLKLTTPDQGAPRLSGKVRLRDSLFLQDVRALRPGGAHSVARRPPYFSIDTPPLNTWRLDLVLEGEKFMRVRTTLFTSVASVRFKLGGTLEEPVAIGEVTIDEGKVRLPFASFDVLEGRAVLTPEQPYEPQLTVSATTRRFGYDLRLELTGTASAPVLTFTSSPSLENGQILLMVMTGESPSTDVVMTDQQRAQRVGAFVGQSLLASLGDSEQVDRLSFETGDKLTEQGRDTYEIAYKLNDRWSVVGEYDEFDDINAGLKWRAYTKGGREDTRGKRRMRATSGRVFSGWRGVVGLMLALVGAGAARAAEKAKEAQIDVSGLNWWGNYEMGLTLERLLGKERGAVLTANAIEDAMFLLMSAVQENGYLKPTIAVEMTREDGKTVSLTLDADMNATVPHDLAAKQVHFTVKRGTHYYMKSVTFTGLQVLAEKTALGFFVGEETLFTNREARTYTPGRLSRGLQSVEAQLRTSGHAEAKAQTKELKIDEKTGEVTVVVEVNEGVPWRIAEMRVDGLAGSKVAAVPLKHFVGQAWTEQAQQDAATEVRRAFYAQGYPDVRVTVKRETSPERDAHKDVVVTVNVVPGEQVKLGEVRFEGRGDVKEPVLRRRVRTKPGDLLNTTELGQARYRISRLGVFERVDISIEPAEGETRDAVFQLTPGRRLDVSLLAGYGSYEELRGGIELRQFNLFGVGHQARAQFVESQKSTRAEYRYTVPEIFGESIDGSARIFGLQREEVAFLRQEFGGSVTLSAPFPKLGVNATAGYTYEALKNTNNELETSPTDQEQVIAASIDAGLTRDRRDNPLTPHRGYRVFGKIEAASQALGGEADYQRIELGIAYHTPWGSGRWVHLSAAHGVILTLGNTDENLPVNKRFYPGEDGSIRSYKDGEAAPRGADGSFIGAKSYVSASVELEQALAQKWSGVIFLDALGTAAELANYPFDETLYGLGAGLRYQTLIGPLRAEYAYNLKQRPGDPSGTFLVTIGFPF